MPRITPRRLRSFSSMLTDSAIASAFEVVTGRPGTVVDRARFAPTTLTEYATCLRRFAGWLAARDKAMPTDAATVCKFLEELAGEGRVPSTVRKYAAAISIAHQHRAQAFDWRALKETLGKVARASWHLPRQARPLLADELKAILAGLVPTRAIDVRDGALLSLGWAAMLRRGELVGLDFHRRGDGQGFARIEHGGIVIVLAKSKTKQKTAVRLNIGPADMPAAIAALEAWIALARPRPGEPLFRAVHGRAIGAERLAPEEVARIVKRRMSDLARAHGRLPDEVDELARATSGHSLRAGCITAMALAKVPEHEIRRRSRHGSAELVARYVRVAEQWADSGLKAVGF
jgi:integrase